MEPKNLTKANINALMNKIKIKEFAIAFLGCLIFSVAMNYFLVPMKLYSGGILGLAQIIRTVLIRYLNLNIPANIDIAGIIYYIVNIPILMLAYKKFSKAFMIKTIIMTTVLTLLMTVIPIPKERVISDTLTGCIVGGILAGVGVGMFLFAGYSAGGNDVISLYFTKTRPGMSVGKMNIIINIFVYGICLFLYDVQTVIYSLIFFTISGVALDKIHEQNINVWLMIFTKVDGMPELLLKFGRGVTSWEGIGAYTKEHTYVHSVMINKYEARQFAEVIRTIDPKAFVIRTEGSQVLGNFEKRL